MTNPTDDIPPLPLNPKSSLRDKLAGSRAASSFIWLFPTLLSVAFGFGLKAWWDESQAKLLQHIETQRALRALNLELQQNIDASAFNMQIVDNDIVAADRQEEVIIPMAQLSIVEGQAVALRGSLESASIEDSDKIFLVYASISTLNQVIQHRELYGLTNGPMSNYNARRKLIDGDLREKLIDTRTAMIMLQEDLRRLRDHGQQLSAP
jgi:hypothetical protein